MLKLVYVASISKHRREKKTKNNMAPNNSEETTMKSCVESPARIENNNLDETLPPCRECERHLFARNSTFNVFDAAIVLISMFTFAADIVTDGLAASQYFVHGEAGWGCLTLGFTLVPCLVMQVFSVRWYLADEDMTGWRWVFHGCLLGPLERYVTVFETGLEARRSKDPLDFERLHHQQSDVCMLRLFESFLESAPQVVLQLYIMVATNDENLFTGISGTVSLFSLCWAVVAYSRAHRRVRVDKEGVSWPGVILQTIWRIGMISSRVVAMVLFASAFKAYTFLVVGIHWLAMVLWVYFQRTDFCDTWQEERLFNAVIGTIYVFCFFNLKEGSTRYRISAFYLLVAMENVALLLLWHGFSTLEDWYTSLGFTVVFGGFITGVVAMILYYRFFHPRGAISLCGTKQSTEKDVCLHGRASCHRGNFEAEIFPRSRTPSPQKSPGMESGPEETPSSDRTATPREYSPVNGKPGSTDWPTARSHRSQSLGCLFATENEWEGGTAQGNAKSLENVTNIQNDSKPLHSQHSPCTCSFQMYELSGFATDLVDRFDRRKDTALARSLLFEESRMSRYSARSAGTAFQTPCRTCLKFETGRGSPAQNRHRSHSQPEEASAGTCPRLVPPAIRQSPQMVVRGTNVACSPTRQDTVLPRTNNESLDVSQVSVELPPMPDDIDSPEAAPTMSAYQVQKIYDQILEREPLPPVSKRQLQFDEEGGKHRAEAVTSCTFDPSSVVPQLADKQAELRRKPHKDGDLKLTESKQVNSRSQWASEIKIKERKPQKYQNPQPTPKQDENIGVSLSEKKTTGNCVHSQIDKVERPEYISPGSSTRPDPKCCPSGLHEICDSENNEASGAVSNHNSFRHGLDDDDNTEKAPVRSPVPSKTESTEGKAAPTTLSDLTQVESRPLPHASSKHPESRYHRGYQIPHSAAGDVNMLDGPDSFSPRRTSISHLQTLDILKGKKSDQKDIRMLENVNFKIRAEDKDSGIHTPSSRIVSPEGSRQTKLHPLDDQKAKSVQEAVTEKEDSHSKKAGYPAVTQKTQKDVLMNLENKDVPASSPVSFAKLSQSSTNTGSSTLHPLNDQKAKKAGRPVITQNTQKDVLTNLENKDVLATNTGSSTGDDLKEAVVPQDAALVTPKGSSVKAVIMAPGKENRLLTPLSARLALLHPSSSSSSPNPSGSPKKPPRKSLGRIPTNLVADNVALFGN